MSPSLRSAVILATHLRAIPGVLAEALQATLAFIVDPEARRARHLVEDEIRALGNAR